MLKTDIKEIYAYELDKVHQLREDGLDFKTIALTVGWSPILLMKVGMTEKKMKKYRIERESLK